MASVLTAPRPAGMRLIDEPYRIPQGQQDFPFCYVFDATGLTDGKTVQNLIVQLQGDSAFILRRIAGVNLCVATAAAGGRWNYRNASQSYTAGNPSTGIVAFPNWVVLPEKFYGANDQIAFDLYDVARTKVVAAEGTIYQSYIGFWGVKRFQRGQGYASTITRYPYREFPQTYTFPLTINWSRLTASGGLNAPQSFWLQMDNYDFELLGVSITQPGSSGTLTTQDFAITAYDPNKFAFSNLPILQGFINRGKPTPATQPFYSSAGPVPSVVYPAGSQIQFDVTSYLPIASLPQTYNIDFQGIWRLPCAGRNPGY